MIRAAVIDDAPAIARVNVATWRSTYRAVLPDDFLGSLTEASYADRWRRFLNDSSTRVYVLEVGRELVGFASGGRERAGEPGYTGELYAIYILDAFQRHGYGRELVRAFVTGMREMGLEDMLIWVLRDNLAARGFYERLGGAYVRAQPITIGSAILEEVSYGWPRLDDVRY
ncbi:MAG TPA: GNAT family N-acetyltransferase [Clostridia bacterium]|nr:GNAT family N-acetyltransferase [Clostridia bacterium]